MAAQYVAVRALNRSAQVRVVPAYHTYKVAVNATAGQFKVVVTNQDDGNSDTTVDVAFNASAATFKTALINLTTSPDLVTGNVNVIGGPGNSGATTPYYVQLFGTAWAQNYILTGITGTTPLSGGGAAATITDLTRNVKLTPTTDVVIDAALAANRRSLLSHSAIGQWIVTATNAFTGTVALPTNV